MKIQEFEKKYNETYQLFLKDNSGEGRLKIRAYAASEALPVIGLKVIVSTMIGNQKVVFYEGYTDRSGMIETLFLPTPIFDSDNLIIPKSITYSVTAYDGEQLLHEYPVNMYDDVCVVQTINAVGGINGY